MARMLTFAVFTIFTHYLIRSESAVVAERDEFTAASSEFPGAAADDETTNIPISRKSFADEGQFPEVAAVFIDKEFVCSGSIIADDAVITAAICLGVVPDLKPEEVSVVVGSINRMKPGALVKAKKIRVHPLFRYYPLQLVIEHDIAIIRLEEKFELDGENISSIKLPTKDYASIDLTNQEGVVAGWGAVAMRNKMLQYVNVTILKQSTCTNFYKKLSPAPYDLDHFQMCSAATSDLCIGESGAGLRVIFEGDDSPTLVGIAEPMADCPQPKRPEIYTRVSEYLDWINQTLSEI